MGRRRPSGARTSHPYGWRLTSRAVLALRPEDLPEVPGEQRAEARERVDAVGRVHAERGQLAREVLRQDVQDAAGDDLRVAVVAAWLDVAAEDPREQRRRVAPEIEAGVVLDVLEASERHRVALAVLDQQPVLHELARALLGGIDEEVEPALRHREPPAQLLALHVTLGAARVLGVSEEALDVVHRDRQMKHALRLGPLARAEPAVVVVLAEADEPLHLLGELQ